MRFELWERDFVGGFSGERLYEQNNLRFGGKIREKVLLNTRGCHLGYFIQE